MRLVHALLLALVLITHYDNLISCNESSEEDGPPKGVKTCPGGYCVSAYLCENGTINMHGENMIEERFSDYDEDLVNVGTNNPSDSCEEFLLRCCASSNGDIPVKQPEPVKAYISDEIVPPPPTCGTNRPNGYIYRVNQTSIAEFGEFPWMAVLLQRRMLLDKETVQYFCGGSLIHPRVILTAAHCVKDFVKAVDKLVVRLGEWDTVTENEPVKHEQLGVRKIILHEDFHRTKLHNDVALVIMEKQASLKVTINPICLPSADDNFDGQRCMVSGWGKEDFNPDGKYSEVLKKIELPVVPRPQCKRLLKATKLGPFFHLHRSFMCAGGEAGVDTCKGDGGSPLACKREDGTFVQSGIVAWGIGCGDGQVPGAYVKVSNFVDWIEDKMQQEGI